MNNIEKCFRKAAELVDSPRLQPRIRHHLTCCVALNIRGATRRARAGFQNVFGQPTVYWFGAPNRMGREATYAAVIERRDARVFALLFMAELAKDQNL